MTDDALSRAVGGLVDLVASLRGPGGCPWDAKQTDDTIKIYLIEEAYEVLEAIETGSPREVCSELGDLLFQIVFLARLAEERGEFYFSDVVEKITRKMVRRHPHVFGDAEVKNAEEVASNWARIKQMEHGKTRGISASLQNIPSASPALLRAHRMGERAAKAGFDWADADEVWAKVEEEVGEIKAAMAKEDREAAALEIGDLLFTLANLSRHLGENAENVLRKTNNKFLKRFQKMEKDLTDAGMLLEEATPDQMNAAWETVKECES